MVVSVAPSLRKRSFDAAEAVELSLSRRSSFGASTGFMGAFGEEGGVVGAAESGRNAVGGFMPFLGDAIAMLSEEFCAKYGDGI